jgi:hypothetical protein
MVLLLLKAELPDQMEQEMLEVVPFDLVLEKLEFALF